MPWVARRRLHHESQAGLGNNMGDTMLFEKRGGCKNSSPFVKKVLISFAGPACAPWGARHLGVLVNDRYGMPCVETK